MNSTEKLTLSASYRCFDGEQRFYTHAAKSTACDMRFGLYLPPQAEQEQVPMVVYLAGLTCTEETFAFKAGAQRVAAELGLALLTPDTSPRGVRLPGDDETYDFGLGAGFYVDATESPWSANYRMYSYVAQELLDLVTASFPVRKERVGLFGHSMGGHGALTIGLKHPERFRSLSAIAPIAAAMQSPWGQRALPRYLGTDKNTWRQYDATELLKDMSSAADRPALLVDQGLADEFLVDQLKPELLERAAKAVGYPLTLRRHAGYDHGYYFISTVIEDHLRHHAASLED
ncbi:MAG: S-formylglutathione hydrolase [Gammaproteobacteria bacterium]